MLREIYNSMKCSKCKNEFTAKTVVILQSEDKSGYTLIECKICERRQRIKDFEISAKPKEPETKANDD